MGKYTTYICNWCGTRAEVPFDHRLPTNWISLYLEKEIKFGGPPQVTEATFCSHDCTVDWVKKDKEG